MLHTFLKSKKQYFILSGIPGYAIFATPIQAQMERVGTDNFFSAIEFLRNDFESQQTRIRDENPNLEPLSLLVTMMGRLKVNVQGRQVFIFKNKLDKCKKMPFDESAVVVLDDGYKQPVSREQSARKAIAAGLRCALQGMLRSL